MINLRPVAIRLLVQKALDSKDPKTSVDALVDAIEGINTLVIGHLYSSQAASNAYTRGDRARGDKYASQARNRLRKLHKTAELLKEELES